MTRKPSAPIRAATSLTVQSLVTGERSSWEQDARYLHADGHAIPVEVYAASVHTGAGEPYCVVAHVLPAGTPLTS